MGGKNYLSSWVKHNFTSVSFYDLNLESWLACHAKEELHGVKMNRKHHMPLTSPSVARGLSCARKFKSHGSKQELTKNTATQDKSIQLIIFISLVIVKVWFTANVS